LSTTSLAVVLISSAKGEVHSYTKLGRSIPMTEHPLNVKRLRRSYLGSLVA